MRPEAPPHHSEVTRLASAGGRVQELQTLHNPFKVVHIAIIAMWDNVPLNLKGEWIIHPVLSAAGMFSPR